MYEILQTNILLYLLLSLFYFNDFLYSTMFLESNEIIESISLFLLICSLVTANPPPPPPLPINLQIIIY